MPINIGKKASAAKDATQAPEQSAPEHQEVELEGLGEQSSQIASNPAPDEDETPPMTGGNPTEQPAPGQAAPTASVPNHQTNASFLVRGDAQKTQVDQVKAVQDLRAKLRTGAREFWLNPGEFAKLVFLDGTLLSDNVFDTPMVAIHMLQIGGSWTRFVCNKHTEGQCVVCDSNADGSQPQTLQLFTVINTMPYTIQNGPNKGKTLPARIQLFAATLKVREKLLKRAKNHGGTLAGGYYQFSRGSKQDPRTGDDIEFLQNVDLKAVLAKYPKLQTRRNAKGEWEEAPTAVYDYATVYPVLTNAEIAQMRPDLASMAGYVTHYGTASAPSGFGSDPSGELDDEIPF